MRVSVAITSCNRDTFLCQAVDSVLAQRIPFPYEIVIGDDASRQGTVDLLERYQAAHPDRIRLVLHRENLGLVRNFASIFDACRGQFVALLDDDDYWSSPEKLQLQVDYMDDHPQCTVCFHQSRHFHEDGSEPDHLNYLPRAAAEFAVDDLRQNVFIPTSSTMIRRSALPALPPWYLGLRAHEWPLQMLCALRGSIGFIDRELSATRIHAGGKWNGKTPVQQHMQFIHDLSTVAANVDGMATRTTRAWLALEYFELAEAHLQAGDRLAAREWSWRAIRVSPAGSRVPLQRRLALLIRTAVPSLRARLDRRRTS